VDSSTGLRPLLESLEEPFLKTVVLDDRGGDVEAGAEVGDEILLGS